MRKYYNTGGRVGFKQGGAYGPLRGTTAGGVAKAFRGKEGFKESQALQRKFALKDAIKKTKKMPDKKFKHVNLDTVKHLNPRTGRTQEVRSPKLVKGSRGKKNYIQEMKYYHHRKQPKGKK